mgnify:CR=1 FL=1
MAVKNGILSSRVKFSFGENVSSGTRTYTQIFGLQSVPSLGGDVDKVETTCLENLSRTYINGLRDYGDLTFKFLYNSGDGENYKTLQGLSGVSGVIKLEIPDDNLDTPASYTAFYIPCQMTVSLDAFDINTALTFTVSAALNGDIANTEPA